MRDEGKTESFLFIPHRCRPHPFFFILLILSILFESARWVFHQRTS